MKTAATIKSVQSAKRKYEALDEKEKKFIEDERMKIKLKQVECYWI